MATIKVKFRASSVEMKEGSLYYQVIHNRLARQVHTGYKLFPSEWDAGISEIVMDSGTEGGAQELPALREDCPSRKLVPFVPEKNKTAKLLYGRKFYYKLHTSGFPGNKPGNNRSRPLPNFPVGFYGCNCYRLLVRRASSGLSSTPVYPYRPSL